jgi:hypothetical protein
MWFTYGGVPLQSAHQRRHDLCDYGSADRRRPTATAALHRTVREALRSDPQSVPLLIQRLDRHAPWGDALLGWVFLALAVAMALLALTESDAEQRTDMLRTTIIRVVIRVAVLAYSRFSARGTQRS